MAEWTSCAKEHPRPHAKYLVQRDGFVHTATPCYGMHSPWWVPMGIKGQEYEPVDMIDSDMWCPLNSFQQSEAA